MKYRPHIYAMYKGDEFLCEGTKDEICKEMNIKKSTFNYYRSVVWVVNRKSKSGKNNRRIIIKLDGKDKFSKLQ